MVSWSEVSALALGVASKAALLCAALGGITILQRRHDTAGKLMGWSALTLLLGDAFHLIPRALEALTGLAPGLWGGVGRMLCAVAITVFCILLLLAWEALSGRKAGFYAEMLSRHSGGLRLLLCLGPIFYSLVFDGDPYAGAAGWTRLLLPGLRSVLLLVLAIDVARLYFKTRQDLPGLQMIWWLLLAAAGFETVSDLGGAWVPALAAAHAGTIVCLLAITLCFVRFTARHSGDIE